MKCPERFDPESDKYDPAAEFLAIVDRFREDSEPLTIEEKIIARMAVTFTIGAMRMLPGPTVDLILGKLVAVIQKAVDDGEAK